MRFGALLEIPLYAFLHFRRWSNWESYLSFFFPLEFPLETSSGFFLAISLEFSLAIPLEFGELSEISLRTSLEISLRISLANYLVNILAIAFALILCNSFGIAFVKFIVHSLRHSFENLYISNRIFVTVSKAMKDAIMKRIEILELKF